MKNEDAIQQEIYLAIRNKLETMDSKINGFVFSVPNGGFRNAIEALKLSKTGVRRGVSDLIVLMPSKEVLFLEVKTKDGRQSKEQIEFENTVKSLGFQYHVVRDACDALKIIDNILTINK
jgi:hypothetical protein